MNRVPVNSKATQANYWPLEKLVAGLFIVKKASIDEELGLLLRIARQTSADLSFFKEDGSHNFVYCFYH